MRHRICGLSTYGLNGIEREISTPPTLRRGTADFTFLPFFNIEYAIDSADIFSEDAEPIS